MGPMYPAALAAGRGQQTGSFSYNRQQQRGRGGEESERGSSLVKNFEEEAH